MAAARDASSMSGGLTPLAGEDAKKFAWVTDPPVQKVMAALTAADKDAARFVGGCVRDSLVGVKPLDIDIATVLSPDETIAALKSAGLKYAPTGLDHGTVTAIADHRGIEVTTLRADVSTDGRRATVAFTQNWAVDASRRDFTLNAIYLTADRKIFDPVGGVAAAKEGRVEFIGEAADRIREDYLRILRFFRFSARFANSELDETGLSACAELKDGISHLSAERVGDEFGKLLSLAEPHAALSAMYASGVLSKIWPADPDLEVFARLKTLRPDAPAPLGLAALWGEKGEGMDAALRLSNADAARRKNAIRGAGQIHPQLSDRQARALLYAMGEEIWRDAVLLAQARFDADAETPGLSTDSPFADLHDLPKRWAPPKFPFTGKHVIAAGVNAGPKVAAALKEIEARWIAEDFPDSARAREILRQTVALLQNT